MTIPTTIISTVKNRCTFFYFDANSLRIDLNAITLNDLVVEHIESQSLSGWLKKDQSTNIGNKHAHDLVWLRGSINTSDDLLPHITSMFNSEYDRVVAYRLSDKATKLIEGKCCLLYTSPSPRDRG